MNRTILLLSLLLLAACGLPERPSAAPAATAVADAAPTATAPTAAAPRPTATRIAAEAYAELDIVTLLPRDAIPAVDDPRFLSAAAADDFYDADELVIGVTFDGEARAYSIPYLSNHEIVNDTVGGVPIAVTW